MIDPIKRDGSAGAEQLDLQLTKQLAEKKATSVQRIAADKLEVMLQSTNELKEQSLSSQAIQTGTVLPDFELPNATGNKTALADFSQDYLVVSFYRGGWCPYCNLELKALQGVLPQLESLNTGLVAISPETPDHSLSTSEKNELSFSVLSDRDNQYAKSLGLVIRLPKTLQEVYDGFNLKLSDHNGNQDYELPMPATFIVNKNRAVIYRFVPEDYTERLDPEIILDVLKKELAVSQ